MRLDEGKELILYRVKDDGYFMFASRDGYFTETPIGFKKYGGNPGNYDDWYDVMNNNEALQVWRSEETRGVKLPIANPWEMAIAESPWNMAYRHKKDGSGLMLRMVDSTTYTEIGAGFTKLESTFRAYDGWKPIGEEFLYASILEKYKDKRSFADVKRIDKIAKPKLPSVVKRGNTPATPEAMQLAGVIAQSLTQAYVATIQTEGKVTKRAEELHERLIQLSRSASWLLYEGRGEYYAPKESPDKADVEPSTSD